MEANTFRAWCRLPCWYFLQKAIPALDSNTEKIRCSGFILSANLFRQPTASSGTFTWTGDSSAKTNQVPIIVFLEKKWTIPQSFTTGQSSATSFCATSTWCSFSTTANPIPSSTTFKWCSASPSMQKDSDEPNGLCCALKMSRTIIWRRIVGSWLSHQLWPKTMLSKQRNDY